ncbi:NUDIX hydrolase [Desmospora profundinema]|uniref:8-oxo-dGTP diphosphatase n=1 Tax=Desmospora profundinema TaxID=1571184 RepID=A0ABU1ILI3_9BACL|nr:8-oxo-dGTP diphosphatase [Desmospora profundinema]MDR6225641.1 8-oxo-dGTP diphosphatase [Desmospora profundinema]
MQRVANCLLTVQGQILMLKKPRRGWWVAPGGKMEEKETVRETVLREFQEETGLVLDDPRLRGVFTMVMEEDECIFQEWMMFVFQADHFSGQLLETSAEGQLAWHPIPACTHLPMSPMDRLIIQQLLQNGEVVDGRFVYDREERLLSHQLSGAGSRGLPTVDPDTGVGYSRNELI